MLSHIHGCWSCCSSLSPFTRVVLLAVHIYKQRIFILVMWLQFSLISHHIPLLTPLIKLLKQSLRFQQETLTPVPLLTPFVNPHESSLHFLLIWSAAIGEVFRWERNSEAAYSPPSILLANSYLLTANALWRGLWCRTRHYRNWPRVRFGAFAACLLLFFPQLCLTHGQCRLATAALPHPNCRSKRLMWRVWNQCLPSACYPPVYCFQDEARFAAL